MKKIFLIIFSISFLSFYSYAQNIENFTYRLQGDSIIVNYDLSGASRDIIVQLFSSNDGYSAPLKLVSGSVGNELKPGNEQTIIWQAKEELGTFKGSIKLKLTARYAPYLEFTNNTITQTFRRGKSYIIPIESNVEDNLTWRLQKGTEEVSKGKVNSENINFDMTLSSKLKKGNDYRLLIEGGGLTTGSKAFSIKSKYPVAVKVVPFLLAGVAVVFLIPEPTNTEKDIPDPFLPE